MAHPIAVSKSVRRAVEPEEGLGSYSTQEIYRELLSRIGEDPERDGLLATPGRVEKSMSFLTKGYDEDPTKILRGALFDVDYDEMVIVKDIELFSLCEHHMLPFFGRACRLYSQWQGHWPEQNSSSGGGFCPSPAGAGAADPPDCRCHSGSH